MQPITAHLQNSLALMAASAKRTSRQPSRTTSDTTDSWELQSDRQDAQALACRLAAVLLMEIRLSWPGQTARWPSDHDLVRSWGRRIVEAGVFDQERLMAALGAFAKRGYPPDCGALLEAAANLGVPEIDFPRSWRRMCDAASSGAYWSLSSAEWHALQKFGIQDLRHAGEGAVHRKAMEDILRKAVRLKNLPPPPEKPAGILSAPPRTPEDLAKGRARAGDLLKMLRKENSANNVRT